MVGGGGVNVNGGGIAGLAGAEGGEVVVLGGGVRLFAAGAGADGVLKGLEDTAGGLNTDELSAGAAEGLPAGAEKKEATGAAGAVVPTVPARASKAFSSASSRVAEVKSPFCRA